MNNMKSRFESIAIEARFHVNSTTNLLYPQIYQSHLTVVGNTNSMFDNFTWTLEKAQRRLFFVNYDPENVFYPSHHDKHRCIDIYE